LTIKTFLTKFKNDQRGIGWVIGMAVLAILFLPVIYFPLNYAWDQLYGIIIGQYTFTGTAAEAINVVQLIISYLMAFAMFTIVYWSIIQAKAKRYEA